MTQQESPVWLITGCSTGFGKELAKNVLARGWRAVVTARKLEQIQDLVAEFGELALALALDVTKPEQVAEAVKQAEARFGRIDVLMNNAGYGYLAAIEEGEDEPVREMFEANFFGLVELTKAVLPGMRARKSGEDREYLVDWRDYQLCRDRLLSCDQVCGGGDVGVAGARGCAAGGSR